MSGNLNDVAYEISEVRKRKGVHKPDGNQTPEEWDFKMAQCYCSTKENIPIEKWLEHFI